METNLQLKAIIKRFFQFPEQIETKNDIKDCGLYESQLKCLKQTVFPRYT